MINIWSEDSITTDDQDLSETADEISAVWQEIKPEEEE